MSRTALILTIGLSLFAQGRPGAEPFRGGPGPRRLGPGAQQGLERLYQMQAQRIQQQLGVSEDRARAITDRWRTYNREWMDRGRRSMQLRHQFNQILIGAGTEDEKNRLLHPMVEEFFTLRRQQAELKQKFEEDIRGGLNAAQQVRLILLVDELHREIMQGIRDAAQQ